MSIETVLDPDEARRRVERGGAVLCLSMPKGSEMQCDLYGWAVGPKFKGIKMVPPGLHFMSWSAGQDKVGVFLSLPPSHVEVWRWNAELEDLEPVVGDEQLRLVQGVNFILMEKWVHIHKILQRDGTAYLTC